MLSEEELERVLKSMAQEMSVAGMKLRRGRYHFSPTRETPPGVRHPIRMDVQGLLMEAARRVDEEPILREFLPSQAISFSQGTKTLPADALGDSGRRIMKLALAGLPLGRIIRQGRTESFVVRDLLKTWCEEGVLIRHDPEAGSDEDDDRSRERRRLRLTTGLRSVTMTFLLICLVTAAVWGRWAAMPAPGDHPGQILRQAQLRAEVIHGARVFRFEEGHWPGNLSELVRGGQLPASTLLTVEEMGWTYDLDPDRKRFRLGG